MRLRNDGYTIEIKAAHLVVSDVPYVNSQREVLYGKIVAYLNLANDAVSVPRDHVVKFVGEYPCDRDGKEIGQIRNSSGIEPLGDGLIVNHTFSAKPQQAPYQTYYDLVLGYIKILGGPAEAIDPNASAQQYRPVLASEEEDVFVYEDTASSRAEIGAVTDKLRLSAVAIVGLGGTGSYILDLLAKVPIKEIHLFDGDRYLQHNAFRSPGAPALQDLEARPYKVDHWASVYSRMHRGVRAHPEFISEANIGLLRGMAFVFIACDRGPVKGQIVRVLQESQVPFIDVGMGVNLEDGSLGGLLRVTTITPGSWSHLGTTGRISTGGDEAGGEYARNIQIADLNALNAALAVVKFKKRFAFYRDVELEHNTTYTIDGNALINDDREEDVAA
jgi:hypothetical protein